MISSLLNLLAQTPPATDQGGGFLENTFLIVGIVIAVFLLGLAVLVVKCYRKVPQGTALVRNGAGGTKISFSGMIVIPVLHKVELMDFRSGQRLNFL